MSRPLIHLWLASLLLSGCATAPSSPSDPAGASVTTETRAPNDLCRAELEGLIGLVSRNYAGWDDKSGERMREQTERARRAADAATDDELCTQLLEDWVAALQDHHLGVRPLSKRTLALKEKKPKRTDPLSFTRMAEGAMLVRLPSFSANQEAPIRALVDEHRAAIADAALLILDVRGNGGGADRSYASVLETFAIGTVKTTGNDVLATPENLSARRWLLDNVLPPDSTARPGLVEHLEKMRQALAGSEPPPAGRVWIENAPDTTETYPPRERPAQVVIVYDDRCGSSCEQFLLDTMTMDGVFLAGTRSAGTLDYSNLGAHSLPSGQRVVQIPTSKTRRTCLIDNIGVEPDLPIAPEALTTLEGEELVATVRAALAKSDTARRAALRARCSP